MKKTPCRAASLSLSGIKKFVELVDGGATAKAYERELGLIRKDVQFHLTLLDLYRSFLDTMKKMDEIKNMDIDEEEMKILLDRAREDFKNVKDEIQRKGG